MARERCCFGVTSSATVMVVHDPIHGQFKVPGYLLDLLRTPEVLRLSQIRLLNTPSPSFAALGEVRRFSHTLGVLALALRCRTRGYSQSEWQAFHASVLLHDIGTNPFGHLVENQLRERDAKWDHEKLIIQVLRGTHAPENRSHQIFAGKSLGFPEALRRNGIDATLVAKIVAGEHPLSQLLFGSIDLDNIDNVVRMAWGLGIDGWRGLADELVSEISVDPHGGVVLSEQHKDLVRRWSKLRQSVYDVLIFDPVAIAAQAVLSEAIGKLIDADALTRNEWNWTDEQLTDRLLQHANTKDAMIGEYFGRLPLQLFRVQLRGQLQGYGLKSKGEAKARIENIAGDFFPEQRILGYAILDRGTFQKTLRFTDPADGSQWSDGMNSESIILHCFLRGAKTFSRMRAVEAARGTIGAFGADSEDIMRLKIGPSGDTDDAQGKFDFATA